MSGPLRGSAYLGYVDSNQGYNPLGYKPTYNQLHPVS